MNRLNVYKPQDADPPPHPLASAKAGSIQQGQVKDHLLPTGLGEQYSIAKPNQ